MLGVEAMEEIFAVLMYNQLSERLKDVRPVVRHSACPTSVARSRITHNGSRVLRRKPPNFHFRRGGRRANEFGWDTKGVTHESHGLSICSTVDRRDDRRR